jgi:hypothetical protein
MMLGIPLLDFISCSFRCVKKRAAGGASQACEYGMCAPLCVCRYVAAFQSGFDSGLDQVQLLFMQSDGGLAPVNAFSGHKAILSGPAGVCMKGCVCVCVHLG